MKKEELRGYDISIQFIKDFEENKIYPLEIFNNTIYDIQRIKKIRYKKGLMNYEDYKIPTIMFVN